MWVEETNKNTADTLGTLETSLNSLANAVFDNRLALGNVLAEQEGVYAAINRTCSTYLNSSGIIETNVKKIYEQAEWLYWYNEGNKGNKTPLRAGSLALRGYYHF